MTSAKLGDDVRRKFDGTPMGLSRIEEYHLKPGEEVYFLGKVEDNSKPVEPHWLMKERSLTESKPDPKNEHSDQIHIQRGDDESGPFTLEQLDVKTLFIELGILGRTAATSRSTARCAMNCWMCSCSTRCWRRSAHGSPIATRIAGLRVILRAAAALNRCWYRPARPI